MDSDIILELRWSLSQTLQIPSCKVIDAQALYDPIWDF